MALSRCAHCHKHRSSLHQHCPHCGQPVDAPDSIHHLQALKRKQRMQDLTGLSWLLMVAGAILHYVQSQGLSQPASPVPVWLMGAGASLYLYLRLWVLLRRIRGRHDP